MDISSEDVKSKYHVISTMRKKGKENRMCNPCRNAGNIWDKTLSEGKAKEKEKEKKHGQLKRGTIHLR